MTIRTNNNITLNLDPYPWYKRFWRILLSLHFFPKKKLYGQHRYRLYVPKPLHGNEIFHAHVGELPMCACGIHHILCINKDSNGIVNYVGIVNSNIKRNRMVMVYEETAFDFMPYYICKHYESFKEENRIANILDI